MAKVETRIDLPKDFRLHDFLKFHQRDAQMLAEVVNEKSLQKGFFWQTMPSCLQLDFTKTSVNICLNIDQGRKKVNTDKTTIELQQRVQHMLGLNQPIKDFEKTFGKHHQLGKLIQQQNGLRVPQSATPFEALSWAITGQQISVNAALSIRRKLILCAGVQHSSGIWCYPDAQRLALVDEAILRAQGFSQTKARTLLMLADKICDDTLPLDNWLHNHWQGQPLDADKIYQKLINLRGIGPWTINYALLRGFGWLDGSLHGDVAVRNRLQQLLQLNEKISEGMTKEWLNDFSPWRALVAAHLWAMS